MAAPRNLTPLAPGEIRFHQAAPPALRPGDYRVSVGQTLRGGDDAYKSVRKGIQQTYRAEAPLTVSGPRFHLKPSEVYSVYPPAGQFGPFDNALPHVVFTRRTLPWERSLDGRPQSADAPVPWMALLLFGRGDFADSKLPKVTSRTVARLLRPEAAVQGPKGLRLETGQTEDDLCNTIDLPATLFAEIAPTAEDLPFLAHVREVKTGGKETLSLKQDGWFTVVLGNRLPATTETAEGEPNLACLVSLEGFGALLPKVDGAGRAAVSLAREKTHVRLAVLASWQFTCHGNNDFKTRIKALDDRSLLRLPTTGLRGAAAGVKAVRQALNLGYTGLNHTTRLGEKTVSWYRGPLVPLAMRPRSPYAFLPCADRALRYDFRYGLFAAEYAAAFELGRLLALQNRGFASAMYRFRNRVAREMKAELARAEVERQLGATRQSAAESLEDVVAALFAGSEGLT